MGHVPEQRTYLCFFAPLLMSSICVPHEHKFQWAHESWEFTGSEYEGEQSGPPHSGPLWYVNYFELKEIETQQTQEKFYLSLNYAKFLLGACPRKRAMKKVNFYLSDLYVGQGNPLKTKYLPLSSYKSLPLEHQSPSALPFLSSG